MAVNKIAMTAAGALALAGAVVAYVAYERYERRPHYTEHDLGPIKLKLWTMIEQDRDKEVDDLEVYLDGDRDIRGYAKWHLKSNPSTKWNWSCVSHLTDDRRSFVRCGIFER